MDGLTKLVECKAPVKPLDTGKLDISVEQWVIRERMDGYVHEGYEEVLLYRYSADERGRRFEDGSLVKEDVQRKSEVFEKYENMRWDKTEEGKDEPRVRIG